VGDVLFIPIELPLLYKNDDADTVLVADNLSVCPAVPVIKFCLPLKIFQSVDVNAPV